MNVNTRNSVRWFKNLLQQSRRSGTARVKTLRGKLMFMVYDPKTKIELPYYDTLPLIFVLEVRPKYILGLNVHYLGYSDRRSLLNALYGFGVAEAEDEEIRLRLRYAGIEDFTKSAHAKVCLKKYNIKQIKNWLLIPAEDWNQMVSLPLYQFHKENASTVWRESHNKLGTL